MAENHPDETSGARVVVLHPGSMGAAVGAELVAAGSSVGWILEVLDPLDEVWAALPGPSPAAALRESAVSSDEVRDLPRAARPG